MYTTLLKSWVGVASFTIPLSGQLVLYTTRSKTLLNVDFIANEACLANLIEFHTYKEGGSRLGKDVGQKRVSSSFWTDLP